MTPRPINIMPTKKSFFGVVKEKIAEVTGHEDKKPRAKWYDYKLRAASQRELRRIRDRDIDRTTKKFRKQQARSSRQIDRHNEIMAVRVLRAFEETQGLPPGGLLEAMLADGTLMESVNERGNRHTGFTPQAILSAAGLTPDKIQELHEELAAVNA